MIPYFSFKPYPYTNCDQYPKIQVMETIITSCDLIEGGHST